MEPIAVDIIEATRISGAGRSKLYEEMAAGRLKARKLGRRTLIEVSELRRWVESLDQASPGSAA